MSDQQHPYDPYNPYQAYPGNSDDASMSGMPGPTSGRQSPRTSRTSRPGVSMPPGSGSGGFRVTGGPGWRGSSPYGGYGNEGTWHQAPSSPYGATYQGGYGQPAPSSQTWGGYGPPSQSGWGVPGMLPVPAKPQRPTRRKLWITLGIVAALLVVAGAGGGFLAYQSFAPAGVVGAFCASLEGQKYADAYNHLSSGFHQRITALDFERSAASLDRIEGRVRSCNTSGGSGSGFQLSGKTATLSLDLARASGGTLSGTVRLTNDGGWKLDALDTSIFGANLEALAVANAYCDRMTTQNYGALYPTLSAAQRKRMKAKDFTQQQQLQDTVDGTATACTLTGLSTGNSDTATRVTATLIRTKLGQRADTISLDVESGAWKISAVGQRLQGTDVGGLVTGTRFCSDLAHGNYSDAWNLISPNFKGGGTEAQFAADFNGSSSGIKITSCTLDASTYKVKGSTATVNATLDVQRLYDGATGSGPVTFTYQKINSAWLMSNLVIRQP